LLGIDEGNEATTRAENQLTLVLEHHLNDLVGVAQEDRLLRPLPLLDIDKLLVITVLTLRSVILREGEL